MATRVGGGYPMNPDSPMNPALGVNPMNSVAGQGGRMPLNLQQPSPAFRTMGPGGAYPRPGMPLGSRMGMPGMQMGMPSGPSFMGSTAVRPGIPQPMMDPFRKRMLAQQPPQMMQNRGRGVKRRKMADKILPQRIRELVPESQAYMDLLAFERKLDQTIMRKRLEIQESMKKPLMQKRKLRIYISNTFTPAKSEGEEGETVASWELRVEGKLLDDPGKVKRKFSSFFKSLVIELDKDLYGPDNHLVEWHRMPTTQETDGFQVKRPGDVNVKCTLLLMLDHQPPQYKLDVRLARLLGVHTQTRANIMQALWLYIKKNRLQDNHEKEYINCNRYFKQIHDTIESINQLKIQRDFMLSFSNHPQEFIQDWLKSQCRDYKIMTDVIGNPEEERRAEFYYQPWTQEGVGRFIFSKVQQRRQELEQVLGIRFT
ncbi:SWI/SNF-related matrix-associated actin-dependent regulator of chromatin subfamily D member 2 isoform X2 [Mobula birostris]|uniref:SWI/SNF-related matrix-associated actin-dependent regulator of chromatin subfamily D member 2 isoform X2 n=1 Tax=Mobula birostris TaxID=1983395 RepID=UPI003B288466